MADLKEALAGVELDEAVFVELLGKLIGEAEKLQNNPPDLIPQENLACQHVLAALAPYSKEQGGRLEVQHVVYTEGRGNIMLRLEGSDTSKVLSFVGSHLDVVPANPETWERPPFEMIREGDNLYGRGTTDCLGHVALLTCLFAALSKLPQLPVTLNAVFIASEEAAGPGVGVDGLMADGKLAPLKEGPVVWVDCADSQPCIGTAGSIVWHLEAVGRLFHSGLPHKGINSIEFASEAIKVIQERFYRDFPPHPEEKTYNFATPSTMKPTQISVPKGGINQLPPTCTISGDIRLTPFYENAKVKAAVESYVKDLNENLEQLDTRGPCSKYDLPDLGFRGKLNLEWGAHELGGIACKLDSPAFKAICKAVDSVKGEAKPYSICGSLPLVGDMQAEGFDIQLIGFGLSSAYHADNEYCKISDMKDATKILCKVIHDFS